ncbi:DinB family protein [Gryllotalpicola protaetiae]|uniref:DinB family protein n=1 Tax=Gryllotalpicola protaetiae TaxID=2419771 RepID=A0A387BNJ6_9MICO|nr:DinB family protein [Gryllotalpicola protaetiae]AYG02566.1 DinB family protein [Gryllotalpicola protaetiae]
MAAERDVDDEKQTLKSYLQRQREALVWKVEGLSERQARWPMTPTGTNLLGLVKHVAGVEYGYFGEVFGRPATDPLLSDFDAAEDNDDFWATPDESIADVIAFYQRAWVHADATIDALSLGDVGFVSWWPADKQRPTLHRVLVHHLQELARHAGHADILRELVDSRVGINPRLSNLPDHDDAWWAAYTEKLRGIAESFP